MTIRPARPSDAASLAALSIEVWVGTYLRDGVASPFADFVLDLYTPDAIRAQIAQTDTHVLVSERSGGLDGYIRLQEGVPCPIAGAATAEATTEITTLYVQPRHHGAGIGGQLLRAGQALQLGPTWLSCNCENTGAIGFYERNGFVDQGRHDYVIDGAGYPNIIFTHSA